jgi:hypothetical protein
MAKQIRKIKLLVAEKIITIAQAYADHIPKK